MKLKTKTEVAHEQPIVIQRVFLITLLKSQLTTSPSLDTSPCRHKSFQIVHFLTNVVKATMQLKIIARQQLRILAS